jgi:hypothetical protein
MEATHLRIPAPLVQPEMARGLQERKRANDIRLDERRRASNGAIDVRFGSTVHDGVDLVLMEQPRDKSLIADITLDEAMALLPRQVHKILYGTGVGEQIERDDPDLRVGA